MVWEPTESVDNVSLAFPPASNATVPRVVAPSLKVTVPEGVPLPGGTAATVAVKVTASPEAEGLSLEVRVTVVFVLCAPADTTWVSVALVLPL